MSDSVCRPAKNGIAVEIVEHAGSSFGLERVRPSSVESRQHHGIGRVAEQRRRRHVATRTARRQGRTAPAIPGRTDARRRRPGSPGGSKSCRSPSRMRRRSATPDSPAPCGPRLKRVQCDHDPSVRAGRDPVLVVEEVAGVRVGDDVWRAPGLAAVCGTLLTTMAGRRAHAAERNVRVIGYPIRTERPRRDRPPNRTSSSSPVAPVSAVRLGSWTCPPGLRHRRTSSTPSPVASFESGEVAADAIVVRSCDRGCSDSSD